MTIFIYLWGYRPRSKQSIAVTSEMMVQIIEPFSKKVAELCKPFAPRTFRSLDPRSPVMMLSKQK